MGHLGLLSRINGGMLCSCGCFCCHLCNSWCSLWFSCSHHGNSENLAEALPYPNQEGAYKGNVTMLSLLSILLYILCQIKSVIGDIVFSISFDTLFEHDAQYVCLFLHKYLQEYVVEDLQGCYIPPKLDPEHESRLKMLKLLWFMEQICKFAF